MNTVQWITILCVTILINQQVPRGKIETAYYIYNDKETAARLFSQSQKFLRNALLWEIALLSLMLVLDMLLILSSSIAKRAFIPATWCVGMVLIAIARMATLIYFWQVHSFLVWDKFYYVLCIYWINMMIGYFKELMEEKNPKLELHLPYLRAVGSGLIQDERIPELGDDPKDPRIEYLILGYTDDLNVNSYVNKWEGVDYFGKIHHFINERSYYHP